MKLLTRGWAFLAALLVGGMLAAPAPVRAEKSTDLPGRMDVHDDAGIFSSNAKNEAKQKLSDTKFDRSVHYTVETHASLPDSFKKKYEATKDKESVMVEWAKSLAKGERAKGPFVLICMKPGWTVVLLDEETRNRKGAHAGELESYLRTTFDNAMKAGAHKPKDEQLQLHDAALIGTANYVADELKGTGVRHTDGTDVREPAQQHGGGAARPAHSNTRSGGLGIVGWIFLALFVLLCIWLVVALIRGFGGGGYYYGGYGWGGGWGPAFFGGMFGVMAGMWMYDQIWGTHYYANEAYASGADNYGDYGADTGDTGAGDYSDGSASADGGDYGDTDGGGGDYGGSDYGGGGDYGGGDYGGGGDFGGGDFGGGGDF